MAIRSKSDPMRVFGLVLIVAFSVVALAVVSVSLKKSTEKRTKAYTCTKVADPKYKVNATSKILSLNPENKEFTWKPDQKSVIRTVLGGCDGATYVRRGFQGEEEGDTPMKFEDLKVGHSVEVIGNSEVATAGARIVPTIIRDVSLYGATLKGKVGRMLFTTDQGGDVIGFVLSDVVWKNGGKALGNPVTVLYSDKVGCRKYGETDYTVANCTGIRVGHMVEVAGVYDATIKSFIDPVSPLPADGSKFWTQIYDASLRPDSNAKDWSTDDVSFTADNFYMVLDGKTYVGDGLTAATSDPADPKNPDYTTILRSWKEKGDEVKVKFGFRKNATHWWVSGVRTFKDGQWTDYQVKSYLGPIEEFAIKAAKEAEFSAQIIDIVSLDNEKSKGKIHFDGLKLKAFLNWITRAPTPTLTPTPTPTLTPTPTPTPVPAPDLTFTSHTPQDGSNVTKPVLVKFTLRNSGTQATKAYFVLRDRSGGTATVHNSNTCVNATTNLNPGGSCIVAYSITFSTKGTKIVTIEADPGSLVTESRENNNIDSTAFNVTN